jgi:multicomponent Na+:H+ antiporter subunit F
VHETVFYVAVLWMAVLGIGAGAKVLLAPTAGGRILALDTLIVVLIGLLVLWSNAEGVAYFMDAALMLAVLAFIGTLAAARFNSDGKLF